MDFIETLNDALFAATTFDDIKKSGLELIRGRLKADGCILIISEPGGRRLSHVYHYFDSPPTDDSSGRRRSYFLQDPMFKALMKRLKNGFFAATRLEDIDDIESFRASELYVDVYDRHGMRQMLSGIVAPMTSAVAVASFYRHDPERSFSRADVSLVRALMPAIGNTIRRIILEHSILGCLGSTGVASDFTMEAITEERGFHSLLLSAGNRSDTAVETVFARHHVLDDEIQNAEERLNTLSEREREIAHLVTKGLTNAQIAHQTKISHRTVEIHVSAILRKVALNNRTELSYLVNALDASTLAVRSKLATDRMRA
ncbi:helix-turn-helix transcriptional regulator [Sphingobium algorifonticola]|uniref:HTH luxR-type domain-containing protein n=1 Tax=Sphingobium algorifonticola TaxID=2008318 RepID=A0A437JA05_9SPHN|nr:LuxR C-terminal-related transcriptional regulator [Sphingobium algorifonticola]RVT42337.1 hypothetical protein ENE74_09090 [Sphingobium algorifonticola]